MILHRVLAASDERIDACVALSAEASQANTRPPTGAHRKYASRTSSKFILDPTADESRINKKVKREGGTLRAPDALGGPPAPRRPGHATEPLESRLSVPSSLAASSREGGARVCEKFGANVCPLRRPGFRLASGLWATCAPLLHDPGAAQVQCRPGEISGVVICKL